MKERPKWNVWSPEHGQQEGDSRSVRADSATDAAETWAERSDYESAEFAIVRGSDATVFVREVGSDEVLRFVVSGESVPSYYAREIKND